jgi:hypothetical protein
MPELLPAAKKFGNRSRHRMTASPTPSSANFLKDRGEQSARLQSGDCKINGWSSNRTGYHEPWNRPNIKSSTMHYWQQKRRPKIAVRCFKFDGLREF